MNIEKETTWGGDTIVLFCSSMPDDTIERNGTTYVLCGYMTPRNGHNYIGSYRPCA